MRLARVSIAATAFVALCATHCANPETTTGSTERTAPAEAVQQTAAPITISNTGGYARLGHVLDENAPLFPGDPPFSSTLYNTVENDGYKLELVSMGTHTGTHMSAPCHFLTGTKCIDDLPASDFVLTSYVIDVRARVNADPARADFRLTAQDIRQYEAQIGATIPSHSIVILYTGFQAKWGTQAYFDPAPGFSKAAVEWMVKARGVISLGSDTFGPDATSDALYSASTAIYAAGGTTIENMAGLDKLHAYGDTVIATPARLKNGSGFATSPIGILR